MPTVLQLRQELAALRSKGQGSETAVLRQELDAFRRQHMEELGLIVKVAPTHIYT